MLNRGGAETPRENQLTEKIIGCAYTVSNVLGCGFFEKVYENALMVELQRQGVGQRADHQRLGQPGHPHQQAMSPSEQGHQQFFEQP